MLIKVAKMKIGLNASKSGRRMRKWVSTWQIGGKSKREDAVTDSRVAGNPAVSHSIFPLAFLPIRRVLTNLPHSPTRFQCVQTVFTLATNFNQHFPNLNKIKILNSTLQLFTFHFNMQRDIKKRSNLKLVSVTS